MDAAARLKWATVDALVAAKRRLPRSVTQPSGDRLGYLLVLPGVVLVGFLFVGLFLLAQYSVLTYDPYEFIRFEYTLANWREFFSEPTYLSVFARTFGLSVVVTGLAIAFAYPYAYLTVRTSSPRLRKLLLVGVFVPFFTGVVVRAYGWLIVFGKNGFLNFLLSLVGLPTVNVVGTEVAVVVGLVQIMIPYAILMIAPSLRAIDPSLERAAANLGANRLRTFRHVVFPLSLPGVTAAAVVVFTLSMAAFAVPAFLGAGLVDLMANFIYSALFSGSNYPLASVLSLFLVVATSLIVFAVFRVFGTGTIGFEGDADA
jgi:putative spermidine/putrescine transport system permease protein